MIELREDQLPALNAPQQPPVAVDPRTGQEYLLIRRDVNEKVCLALKPFTIRKEDAEEDLIRKDV
jgi:hypothetical protein